LFFKDQTIESLTKVLERFGSEKFGGANIAKSVASFSAENFKSHMKKFIDTHLEQ